MHVRARRSTLAVAGQLCEGEMTKPLPGRPYPVPHLYVGRSPEPGGGGTGIGSCPSGQLHVVGSVQTAQMPVGIFDCLKFPF
jgi:hypothetical protein